MPVCQRILSVPPLLGPLAVGVVVAVVVVVVVPVVVVVTPGEVVVGVVVGVVVLSPHPTSNRELITIIARMSTNNFFTFLVTLLLLYTSQQEY